MIPNLHHSGGKPYSRKNRILATDLRNKTAITSSAEPANDDEGEANEAGADLLLHKVLSQIEDAEDRE